MNSLEKRFRVRIRISQSNSSTRNSIWKRLFGNCTEIALRLHWNCIRQMVAVQIVGENLERGAFVEESWHSPATRGQAPTKTKGLKLANLKNAGYSWGELKRAEESCGELEENWKSCGELQNRHEAGKAVKNGKGNSSRGCSPNRSVVSNGSAIRKDKRRRFES